MFWRKTETFFWWPKIIYQNIWYIFLKLWYLYLKFFGLYFKCYDISISSFLVYIPNGMIFVLIFELFWLELFLLKALAKPYTIEMTTLMIVTLSANHLTDHEYKTALRENFFWHSLRFKYKLCLCSVGITLKAAAALAFNFFYFILYKLNYLFTKFSCNHFFYFLVLLMRSFYAVFF